VNYRTVVVDDEPLALKRLERLLQSFPGIVVVGRAASVAEAVATIEANQPDLLFLDIDLPDGDGFDVLRRLEAPPLVIFTTGHDQHALRAFEAASVDYVLKPVETEKLARALQKLRRFTSREDDHGLEERLRALMSRWQPSAPTQRYLERISVRLGERTLIVDLSDVMFFSAKDKYVFLHTASKEHIIEHTLAELETRLDPNRFVRVHRSTIVSVDKIREIQTWFGGKYRLALRDSPDSEIVVSKGMSANLRALVPF
jgi:two-component system LytT family response regulator